MRNHSFTPLECRMASRIIRTMIFFLVILAVTVIANGPTWFAVACYFITQVTGVFGLVWATRLLMRREKGLQDETKN